MPVSSPFRTIDRRVPRGTIPRLLVLTALLSVIVAGASLLAVAAEAPDRVRGDGKDYGLSRAHVTMQVQPDGTVDVAERITFDFRGSFSGAYRDIPMRRGDEIDRVQVCEPPSASSPFATVEAPVATEAEGSVTTNGCPDGLVAYREGGSTELGSFSPPGSFGTDELENPDGDDEAVPRVERVVWHYDAYDTQRTFTITYRARGWVRRTSDGHVVLEARPWGTEWRASLGELSTEVRLPDDATTGAGDLQVVAAARGAGRVRASVSGLSTDAASAHPGAAVVANDLTSGEGVSLHASLPAVGSGIDKALPRLGASADSALAAARAEARDNRRTRTRLDTITAVPIWLRTLLAAVAGALVAAFCAHRAWVRALREIPWPDSVPRLLTDPPGDLPPALAASLVEQRREPSDTALVATVFDLLRRGAWQALPAQGTARGARVDLELRIPEQRDQPGLRTWEQLARQLVDRIVGKRGAALGEFKSKLKGSRSMSQDVGAKERRFRQSLTDEITKANWFERGRSPWLAWPSLIAAVMVALSIVLLAWDGLGWLLDSDPRLTKLVGSLLFAAGASMLATLLVVVTARAVLTRWRASAREEAARWTAYRDYLDAYGDMADEQTASIELWERHLVYAIAFGCADDILSAVRPEGAAAAAVGGSGLGTLDSSAFHGFSSGIAARAPTPSSSSGGGSSSSFGGGGGGFGGGGGGGGAW